MKSTIAETGREVKRLEACVETAKAELAQLETQLAERMAFYQWQYFRVLNERSKP